MTSEGYIIYLNVNSKIQQKGLRGGPDHFWWKIINLCVLFLKDSCVCPVCVTLFQISTIHIIRFRVMVLFVHPSCYIHWIIHMGLGTNIQTLIMGFSQNNLLSLKGSTIDRNSLVLCHTCMIFTSSGSSVLALSIEQLYLTSGISSMSYWCI